MTRKVLRVLAPLVWCFMLGVLLLQVQPAKARPPLQGPTEEPKEGQAGQVQPAAYVLTPTINYQGYLADAGGTPINSTLDFTASLYNADSDKRWGPELHSGVQVEQGLFSLVLGQTVSLSPYIFYEALYLELEVDGVVLPRQTLRTVPYAFSLVPGAHIEGRYDSPMVQMHNGGNSFALRVTEFGLNGFYGLSADRIYSEEGYASDADSYWWAPGNLVVSPDATLVPHPTGAIEVSSNTNTGSVDVPVALLTQLYGHDVVLKEVRVYYYTSSAATYIDSTDINKLVNADVSGGAELLGSTDDNQASTSVTSYNVPIDATSAYTLTAESGPLNIHMIIHFDQPTDSVYIGGVRVQLGHPRQYRN